jgi:hypothetical protein
MEKLCTDKALWGNYVQRTYGEIMYTGLKGELWAEKGLWEIMYREGLMGKLYTKKRLWGNYMQRRTYGEIIYREELNGEINIT